MDIVLTNTTSETIFIPDLALEIAPNESIDLSSFTKEKLLASNDITNALNNNIVNLNIDQTPVTYNTFVTNLSSLTGEDHESFRTLKHNISENYYFESEKDANNQTKFITYYKNATKEIKIRQEEIVRNISGSVSQIILRNYNDSGSLQSTEIQNINRNMNGKVENITVEV